MIVDRGFWGEFEVSFMQVFKKTLEYQMAEKYEREIILKARKNGQFSLIRNLRKNHLKSFEKA